MKREGAAPILLALMALLVFWPLWAKGLFPYWGDITYLANPWKAASLQALQSGRLPLWDPYASFGMPFLAEMQNGLFYPGGLPFLFFGFAPALRLYLTFHYWMAGWLFSLWLRRLGLGRKPALAGAAIYAFSGYFMGRMPWPNQIGVLALAGAFLLFFDSPALLGLCAALGFFSGYPVFLAGLLFSSAALARLSGSCRMGASAWPGRLAAAALAAGIAACLLLPAIELLRNSVRASGLRLEDIFFYQLSPRDFLQWISPVLAGAGSYSPQAFWWKSNALGFIGAALAIAGWAGLGRGRKAWSAAFLGGAALLLLGNSTALSAWVWRRAAFLHYIRYPGNLAFLALPWLAFLAALGLRAAGRRVSPRAAGLLLAGLGLELWLYAYRSYPVAQPGIFTRPGPLARFLEHSLSGRRYLLSPRALDQHGGWGVWDWKFRLYGLTNLPFRIRSGGNVGEPLVPGKSYRFIDFLYTRKSAREAARFLPWGGIRTLLLPRRERETGPALVFDRSLLWELYDLAAPASRAYWFDDPEGAAIPAGLPAPAWSGRGRALPVHDLGEEAFWIAGKSREPGWVFLSEPRYPGWRLSLGREGRDGREWVPVASAPALEAFQKFPVPSGSWVIRASYDPASVSFGVAATAAVLLALAGYGYKRVGSMVF